MRTRFLNIDYFNSSASIQASETLNFLRLPVPHFATPYLCSDGEQYCFDSILSISQDVESLPIEDALSRFLEDVLPHAIDAPIGDIPSILSQNGKVCSDCRSNAGEESASSIGDIPSIRSQNEKVCSNCKTKAGEESASSVAYSELRTPEKENERTDDNRVVTTFQHIHFETPELDLLLEYGSVADVAGIAVLSETQEIKVSKDMLKPVHAIQCFNEVEESVYSVENISPEIHFEQNLYAVGDSGSVQTEIQTNRSKFPLLEVDEISLETFTSLSMEKELRLFLETIKPQNLSQLENPVVDEKEFLSSTDSNVLKFLDHSLIKQRFKVDYSSSSSSMEINFSVLEMPNGDSLSLGSPILYEEYQILDLDFSQIIEIFLNPQSEDDIFTCEQMFKEGPNFKDFNELVVSHELALVDDTFRSFPIPILTDNVNKWLLFAVIAEVLVELEPHPPCASDGIYLDWLLLEEDKCKCGTAWHILEDICTLTINLDLRSFDNAALVLDTVFYGEDPLGVNTEEYKEILDTTSECHETGNREIRSETNANKVSSLFESMSQCSDLDFFLNRQKVNSKRKCEPSVEAVDPKAAVPDASYTGSIGGGLQLQQWVIKVHPVTLSDNILALIDEFQKKYLLILGYDTELTVDSHKLLSLPKQKLMDYIKHTSAKRNYLAHGDGIDMVFCTLLAIKQMAWYLCFYGIHATHLYVEKLCQSVICSKSTLSSLLSLISDAVERAEKDVTESHPSLPVIKEILCLDTTRGSLKVLIVAEKVFWWPLKRLLLSMGKSFIELQNIQKCTDHTAFGSTSAFIDTTLDSLLHSDCLLMSHEHVTAAFPFNKFSIIIEYGDSYDSSRISTVSSKSVGVPPLHFLKVELDHSGIPKALCEGVDLRHILEFTVNLEKLQDAVPAEEKCDMGYSKTSAKEVMKFKQISPSKPSCPNSVIVVNTQNFDKELIISRRSTYQRILAMEKEGVQVIERDLDLPVDVIVSAAICLVWYDCNNIQKKATALDEASSCLPLCIENLATHVLTMLSLTFSGCILVFEGETNFLSAIMESSDVLYAAAASLGIKIQLFCSYAPELTDEIILNSIKYASKSTKDLYPQMPESETLAESFLTKFPSINPLSAHAILSTGGMLIDFLKWSNEHRICAIQRYRVPDESISLLSALSRYGEREDSKSGTTDCSSSVSSAPDSDKYLFKVDSGRKKRKYIGNTIIKAEEMPTDDFLQFDKFNKFRDGIIDFSVSKPYDNQVPKGHEILAEIEEPNFSFKPNLVFQKQGFNRARAMKNSRGTPQMSVETTRSGLSLNDDLFGQKQGLDMPMNDDFIGEVIDFNHSSVTPLDPVIENHAEKGNYNTSRRLLFSQSGYPTFPTAADINADSDIQTSVKFQKHNLDKEFNNDNLSLKHQKKIAEDSMQRSVRDLYGGTPLSNALRSSNLPQESPWTIEFLNRIREKSRLRKKSLPHDKSSACVESFRNTSKATKRKSPSIFDFYKYQGKSTPNRTVEQRRDKRPIQTSCSSKNETHSAPLFQALTPMDKRAKRTLSFTTTGNGKQTRLVWTDGNS